MVGEGEHAAIIRVVHEIMDRVKSRVIRTGACIPTNWAAIRRTALSGSVGNGKAKT
jgi:hypothetical protein